MMHDFIPYSTSSTNVAEFVQDSRHCTTSQDSSLICSQDSIQDSRLFVPDSRLNLCDLVSPDINCCVQDSFSPDSSRTQGINLLDNAGGQPAKPFISDTPPFSPEARLDVSFLSSSELLNVNSCLDFQGGIVVSPSISIDPPSLSEPHSFVSLHNRVYAEGKPNFLGAQLAVPTSFNLPLWRSLLSEYSDVAVCNFLEFGWPIGFDYSRVFTLNSSNFRNHKGALDFSSAVDSYLSSEISFGAVCGPFARNPFSGHMAVSPLNSVPKPASDERRFILDLSWPSGSSVNDGISKEFYLGDPVTLTYPTVDDIAARIARFGSGCLLFKRDLKRAYRQLPVDPFDYPLLGYSWRDSLYFDVRLPMGLRSAAMACQRVTQAVCFMLSQAGCDVLSYLDDFMGIAAPSNAAPQYAFSGTLLHSLGLQESSHKACPPSTQVTCLGVLFDTVAFTMSVTPARLQELKEHLLPLWLTKKSATKTELQSLIGKLSFVSKCVRPGRLFLTRILDTLRSLRRHHHRIKLSAEFRKDIHWWLRFISVYNGVSLIPTELWSEPDGVFSTDACLNGCGGMSTDQYFHTVFPAELLLRFQTIHLLEASAIIVALRLWGHRWRGMRILVYCDNFSVVSSLNSGRVQDKLLASCLREIWFLAAVHEFEIRARHLSSSENRGADLLSRWHLNKTFQNEFVSTYGAFDLQPISVPVDLFILSDSV